MSLTAAELRDVEDHEVVAALMQQILDRIVAHFEQVGVPVPDRQYITVGAVAHDCEQLVVSFRQLYAGAVGAPANEPVVCNGPRSVVLVIELVRKVALPQGRTTPPTALSITEHTQTKMTDAWLLLDAAMEAAGEYVGVLADVSMTNPGGEYQAIVLNLTVGVP